MSWQHRGPLSAFLAVVAICGAVVVGSLAPTPLRHPAQALLHVLPPTHLAAEPAVPSAVVPGTTIWRTPTRQRGTVRDDHVRRPARVIRAAHSGPGHHHRASVGQARHTSHAEAGRVRHRGERSARRWRQHPSGGHRRR